MTEEQVYDTIGEDGFARLVRAFYAQVPGDDILGRLYPPHDLEGAEQRLRDGVPERRRPAVARERGEIEPGGCARATDGARGRRGGEIEHPRALPALARAEDREAAHAP